MVLNVLRKETRVFFAETLSTEVYNDNFTYNHFSYYKVKLTLESDNKEQLEAACSCLEESLPQGKKHITSLTSFEVFSDKIQFSCNTTIAFSKMTLEISFANRFKKATPCNLYLHA